MNPEQLRETTLDPSKRLLRRITIEDAAKAALSFDILMGKNAAPRWEFIVENALRAETMNI